MNQKQPLVSVIIPVYNVEPYISDCLDSLLRQTYRNWQAIVINDGSTDKSLEICEKYADNDSRIKVISTANRGSACARNHGLDNADGEYVIMVDADDTIPQDAIRTQVDRIRQLGVDIVSSNCMATTPSGSTIKGIRQPDGIHSSYETLRLIHSAQMISGIWSKIYRRDIIASHRFNPRLRMVQDIFFNTELLLLRPDITVAVTNDVTYCYRYRPDSITHTNPNSKMQPYLEEMTGLIERNAPTCPPDVIGTMSDAVFSLVIYSIYQRNLTKRLPDDVERDMISRLRSTISRPKFIRIADKVQRSHKATLLLTFSALKYNHFLRILKQKMLIVSSKLKNA